MFIDSYLLISALTDSLSSQTSSIVTEIRNNILYVLAPLSISDSVLQCHVVLCPDQLCNLSSKQIIHNYAIRSVGEVSSTCRLKRESTVQTYISYLSSDMHVWKHATACLGFLTDVNKLQFQALVVRVKDKRHSDLIEQQRASNILKHCSVIGKISPCYINSLSA